jgi:starch synthase
MPVKINILSPSRFHVCDLARELYRNGFDVKFYSYVPTSRSFAYGLPKRCSCSLFYVMLPFLILQKFLPFQWAKNIRMEFQDFCTGIIMRKADIVIAMSGEFVYALKKAKQKGEIVILERGSKHIIEQQKILENIPSLKSKKPVPNINIKRELEGYNIADYLSVATLHVKRSFMLHNYPVDKLFVNPYGVDLKMFAPMPDVVKKYDFIMVGGWSFQKGCDLLVEAIKQTDYTLLHVGCLVDLKFPESKQFTHVDAVDQTLLVNYYNQAKVFVLPSRQEGLAMVQAQAIACNMPIIGSKDSGAEDLKSIMNNTEYIMILQEYSSESLLKALYHSMKIYKDKSSMIYPTNFLKELSWESYGKRYTHFINLIIR